MNNMHSHHANSDHTEKMYLKLLLMAALSFVAMYILMYTMVDKLNDIYPSFNQLYMAGLMAAPMVLIEIVLMGTMYKRKKLNIDEDQLIPKLPKPSELRPFPTMANIYYKGHEARVRGLAIHHSGLFFASGDEMGFVIVWEVLTGRIMRK